MNTKFKINTKKKTQRILIDTFGGVDFLSHPDKVDMRRSPEAKNMLCSDTGFLHKRDGYKRLFDFGFTIYGIHRLMTQDDGEKLLVHAGSYLYLFSKIGEVILLADDMAEGFSSSFTFKNILYILDGRNIKMYDGEAVSNLKDSGYAPLTTRFSDNGSMTGEAVETPNMLSPRRRNTFIGNGAQGFLLDSRTIDTAPVTVKINGTPYQNFTVGYNEGLILLDSNYPAREQNPIVEITFSKTFAQMEYDIHGCTLSNVYGEGNDLRVFLSGNPSCQNIDFMSAPFEPTYFPIGCVSEIGSRSSAVLGYLSTESGQLILKGDNGQDFCKYLRTLKEDCGETKQYVLSQAGKRGGLLSKRSFAEVLGSRLYLSDGGVLELNKNALSGYDNFKCVSDRINPRLLKEDGLQNAQAVLWKNRYYIFVNSKAYVADCRNRGSDGQFEWYYFDNLPVSAALATADTFYLGMSDGRLCRFTKEEDGGERYYDDGVAVKAVWSTPVMTLGSFDHYKWLYEFKAVLTPYSRSGVELYYNTERTLYRLLKSENADLFSFSDIDFSRFTFRSISASMPVNGKTKQKCYVFQGIAESVRPEPLGVLAFTIGYKTAQAVR